MRRQRRASDYAYFDNGGRPIAFAHRGGRLIGDTSSRENSMAAFQAAVDLGYAYVETDVHATRDEVLVAFHDPTLERTTDAEGVISELAYADLERVKVGGTEPIPRLSELLATWPDLKVNIDAKSPSSVALLARTIDEHRAWDRVCVASFSPWRLRQLRRALGPRVATACSATEAAGLLLLPTRPLRRVLVRGGLAAQVPVRRGPLEVVTPSFLDHAHELGTQVHVWTINEPEQMHRLLDRGVDGLVSDHIDVLRDVYRSRGIWTGPADER